MAANARMWISMTLTMLIGLAYVVWLAWAEGWRLWVVVGVLILVATIGGIAHMVMAMVRDRDGLDKAEPEEGTDPESDAEGRV